MSEQSIVVSGITVEEAVIEFRSLLSAFRDAAGDNEPAWLAVIDRHFERVESSLIAHQSNLHRLEQTAH